MKKQNNKGFTLVELVIVIAVIAILAGVLIGTFATVISRANQSKALQVAKAAFDETWVEFVADEHEIPTWITVDAGVVTLYNAFYKSQPKPYKVAVLGLFLLFA